MPQPNTLIVHDTQYEVSRAYKEGALAYRDAVPNNCNPYKFGCQSHDEWDYGHVNDSAGEHFRFGLDLMAQHRQGKCFEMDPQVPRIDGGDAEDEWVRDQRKKFGLSTH